MTYKAQSADDIWGIALNLYGDAAGIVWLITDNLSLIEDDGSTEVQGKTLQVRSSSSYPKQKYEQPQKSTLIQQIDVVANSEQTLWDIALQQYGDAEALFWLMSDNELVNSNGLIPDGRRQYRLRNEFKNISIRSKMLEIVPTTGQKSQNETWTTEDGQDWTTDGGQSWWTAGSN